MKKSTKGALAVASAGALLLGGAGSLAYWTDSQTITGGDIGSGQLALSTPSCGGWTYDEGEVTSGATFTPGTSKLVPGDVITQTCTTTLTAVGEHMRGSISVSTPTTISPFVVDVGSITGASPALGTGNEFTEANDSNTLEVEVTVTLPASETGNQDVSKTLDDITLTATQVHS